MEVEAAARLGLDHAAVEEAALVEPCGQGDAESAEVVGCDLAAVAEDLPDAFAELGRTGYEHIDLDLFGEEGAALFVAATRVVISGEPSGLPAVRRLPGLPQEVKALRADYEGGDVDLLGVGGEQRVEADRGVDRAVLVG